MVRGWVWDFKCEMATKDLAEKVKFESELEGGEETDQAGFWEEGISGRGTSLCRGSSAPAWPVGQRRR